MPPADDEPKMTDGPTADIGDGEMELRVRRIHRRDLNRVWEFLKLVFRDVNRETVEYQRPRSKSASWRSTRRRASSSSSSNRRASRFELVGYAECAYEIVGTDSWMNERYFEKHDMRPLFVEELAVHPDYRDMGIGSFMLEQLEHAARLRGCTHLVLEVAENNEDALRFYRKRSFYKLDAAVFLSRKLEARGDLLSPRTFKLRAKPK